MILPAVDGMYMTGAALDAYVAQEILAADTTAALNVPVLLPNAAAIQAMIVLPAEAASASADTIKLIRARLLSKCDWRMVPDATPDAAVKAAWATYRQALRDITLQPSFPTVTWPVPPSPITGLNEENLTNPDGTPTPAVIKMANRRG